MRPILYFLTLLAFCTSQPAMAQRADVVNFENLLHDFGTVEEEGGPIEYEFKFTNVSPDTIKVLRVRASCGCTTPGWSREPVPPGEEGFVKAQYKPYNRPGAFNKYLTVTLDKQTTPLRLVIKGNVNPRKKSVEEELPAVLGNIRVQSNIINMGNVYTTDTPTEKTYVVYNSSDSAITFLDKTDRPDYIDVSVQPQTLDPKEKGEIKISYDAKARNDYGFTNDNLTIYTNEADPDSVKSFSVYANIYEYFPPMSAKERADGPKPSLSVQTHDFGRITAGDKKSLIVTLSNTGKEDLLIRKIQPNCSCITAESKKTKVAPGKSTEIEIVYDSSQGRGTERKAVVVYTNSPVAPTSRLTLSATVDVP